MTGKGVVVWLSGFPAIEYCILYNYNFSSDTGDSGDKPLEFGGYHFLHVSIAYVSKLDI